MVVIMWVVSVYFICCAAICWCCCTIAGGADRRVQFLRRKRQALVRCVLCQDHQWFFRTDGSKLRMHLLRRAYRKDAWIERTRVNTQRELLCVHVPDFFRHSSDKRKSFRV